MSDNQKISKIRPDHTLVISGTQSIAMSVPRFGQFEKRDGNYYIKPAFANVFDRIGRCQNFSIEFGERYDRIQSNTIVTFVESGTGELVRKFITKMRKNDYPDDYVIDHPTIPPQRKIDKFLNLFRKRRI